MIETLNKNKRGHMHPISLAINDISRIFMGMGFDVNDGPELEDEWHNFDALNVPPDHPARDMQDTFWIKATPSPLEKGAGGMRPVSGHVLRTHTSNVQIRTMEKWIKEKRAFPLAMCAPGKVYRNEATDATHEAQFHQVEMLYVGEDASLAMMIGVTEKFFSEYFGKDLKIRLRSSYFPFVEPGNEVDMECFKCEGSGCNICKGTGWIELGGAGMVHPKVLAAAGVDASKLRGFAFGCGIDRMVMLKYGLDDVRLLYNGDLRVVNQF
jgi:phenylalanyl-tRNA synthetase alpha chain